MNGLLRASPVRVIVTTAVSALVAACFMTTNRGGELEARVATVHNALSAMGMAEVGPLHQAHLEGEEAKIDLELAGGCTTIVAVGAATITDLDASLVDSAGKRLARGTAHTSDATIRACNDAAGTYTLRLKAAHGSGAVLVSTWAGGSPGEAAVAARGEEAGRALGTCEAPLPLSAGDFSGNTSHSERQNEAKGCANANGPELVYKLDVPVREKVLVAIEAPHFDSLLYIRKEDCSDQDAEVACNDDAPPPGGTDKDREHSRIEEVLEAGSYYVFVDGYQNGAGAFRMHVEMADVPPLAEVCKKAQALADGVPENGTTEGEFDNVTAACGDGAHGPDSVYSLTVSARSRVRVTMHADDFAPVVHLRSRCDDPDTAVGCADTGGADHEATFLGILDPGAYTVFADSSQREAAGKYTISADVAPEAGSGVKGDRCRDAIPLTKADLVVMGDTFAARDDVATACGGTGAPDVVYRWDVTSKAHFTARITRQEGGHVLALLRSCEPKKAEIECGAAIDRLLTPGSYYLVVDGASPQGFGTFTLEWNSHDTQAQEVACRAPPQLREGQSMTGSTMGSATDKFSPSCAGNDATGGAPDVVYKVVLANRRRVRLHLHTGGWAGVLSVRRSCMDGDGHANVAAELDCRADDAGELEYDGVLDPGTYYVVVDGKEPTAMGPFTLDYDTAAAAAPPRRRFHP